VSHHHWHRGFNYGAGKDSLEEASRLYRRAIALDPKYAVAYALPARTLWMIAAHQFTKPAEEDLAEYASLARTGVRFGHADTETLCIAAHIIALPGGDLLEGIAIIDRALVQNPNSVDALAISGMLRAYSGDTEGAFRHLNEAERLSPPGVHINLKEFGFCLACFVDGDYAGVLDWTAQTLRKQPANVTTFRYRIAALALLGRLEEARQTVDRFLP
jgi:adenylate cyclase